MKFYKSKLTDNQNYIDVAVINFGNFDIEPTAVEVADVPIHYIQILDRSGSMYGDIDELIENVKETIRHMKETDFYTVIWFSGKGEFRTILKGISCNHSQENEFKVLDSIKSVIGLTCFNEATSEAISITDELKDLCGTVSITLFTDGMSTVSGDNLAMTDLLDRIVDEYNDKIIAFNTIGYGDYCEETLLSCWSNRTQYGIFTHQSHINQYFDIFSSNSDILSDVSANSIDIELKGDNSTKMYYSTNKFVRKIEDRKLSYTMCPSKNQIILVSEESSMDDLIVVINGIEYPMKDVKSNLNESWIDSIFYKLAYAEYTTGNAYASLRYLSLIGDKDLIDDHMNSFNKFERAKHTAWLKKAVRSTQYRNPQSADINYIPDPNVPCVIDLLTVIATNNCLYDPNYVKYSRIGKKVEDRFNMFVSNGDLCEISDIVFNEEHLNVSIRFKMDGYVRLNPRQAKEVGLNDEFGCSIFRTHTIIKDGNFNVETISIKTDKPAIQDYIKDNFGYAINSFSDDGCMVINLTKIPVVNRSYNNVSIDTIYQRTKNIAIARSYLKVIKYLISQLPSSTIENRTYTDEQVKLLSEYSIRNGIYNGIDNKTPVNGDCDFYVTRTVKFFLKGFSSSSVLSPVTNLLNGKSKKSDIYMIQALEKYQDEDDIEKLKLVERSLKTQIIEDSKLISASKISTILTGDFYDNVVPSKKEGVYTYDPGNGDILNVKVDYDREYFTIG